MGWQARMDEQAGLQEHQRTASVPPNPPAVPPYHPRQSWEWARARRARAATAHSTGSEPKLKSSELESCNRYTLM